MEDFSGRYDRICREITEIKFAQHVESGFELGTPTRSLRRAKLVRWVNRKWINQGHERKQWIIAHLPEWLFLLLTHGREYDKLAFGSSGEQVSWIGLRKATGKKPRKRFSRPDLLHSSNKSREWLNE